MLEIHQLPHVTATFNAIATVFLLAGFICIKNKNIAAHKACMLSALTASACFLVVYLIYHFNSGIAKFGGEGLIRPVYFTLLIIHVMAAVAITPLVPMLVWRAFKGEFDRHKKMARYTWPLWFFVSVSGVVIYVMAIHLYPWQGGPGA